MGGGLWECSGCWMGGLVECCLGEVIYRMREAGGVEI